MSFVTFCLPAELPQKTGISHKAFSGPCSGVIILRRLHPIITPTQIQHVSDEIARQFQPERIILFGSYAYGTPTEDSDVDLLVVLPFEGRKAKKATEIRLSVRAGFAMDLIPITLKRLKYRIEIEGFFCEKW